MGGKVAGSEALRLLLKGERYETESARSPAGILAALESRDFTAASPLMDEPLTVKLSRNKNWSPHNYDERFRGAVSLRTALEQWLRLSGFQTATAANAAPITKVIDTVRSTFTRNGSGAGVPARSSVVAMSSSTRRAHLRLLTAVGTVVLVMLVVFLVDDMEPTPGFVAAHLAAEPGVQCAPRRAHAKPSSLACSRRARPYPAARAELLSAG